MYKSGGRTIGIVRVAITIPILRRLFDEVGALEEDNNILEVEVCPPLCPRASSGPAGRAVAVLAFVTILLDGKAMDVGSNVENVALLDGIGGVVRQGVDDRVLGPLHVQGIVAVDEGQHRLYAQLAQTHVDEVQSAYLLLLVLAEVCHPTTTPEASHLDEVSCRRDLVADNAVW